jgi:RHS repeat-associated protein
MAGQKEPGSPITFTGSLSHDNDSIRGSHTPTYYWFFDYPSGDNAITTVSTINHTYAVPGHYNVRLIYFDDDGQSDTCNFDIYIGVKRFYYLTDHLGSVKMTVQDGWTMVADNFDGTSPYTLDKWMYLYGNGFFLYTGTLAHNSTNESMIVAASSANMDNGIINVNVKFNTTSAVSASLVYRYSNYYYYTVDVFRDSIRLAKKRPWDNTIVARVNLPSQATTQQWYPLQVTLDSNKVFVYWNNQCLISWTDNSSPLLTGKVGFRENGSYTVMWDNLIVRTPVKVVSADDYDPWGMQLEGRCQNTGQTNDKYKFTGKERDKETANTNIAGYDYFGARYYDNRIGRWMSVDPMAENTPSLSPYQYARNNPLNRIDPDGAVDTPTVILAGVIIVAAAPIEIPELIGAGIIAGGIYGGKWLISHYSNHDESLMDVNLDDVIKKSHADQSKADAKSKENNGQEITDKPKYPVPELDAEGKPVSKEWIPPTAPKGNWTKAGSKESLRPGDDSGHGPHTDWRDPGKKTWRIYPDGRVEPKFPGKIQ